MNTDDPNQINESVKDPDGIKPLDENTIHPSDDVLSRSLPSRKNEAVSSSEFQLEIFLCHSFSDKAKVRVIYQRLRDDGFRPWLEAEDLLPGQDWQLEIRRAIKRSGVVVVCLSRSSITKAGFAQREIRMALDVAYDQPEGAVFIIPLKLEECDIPDRLSQWHWVNIFEENGYELLTRALRRRAETLKS